MKKLFQEKIISRIFNILATVLYLILFGYSLFLTGNQSENIRDEFIYIEHDSFILNVLFLGCALSIFLFLGKAVDKIKKMSTRNFILSVVCVLAGGISVYWVIAANALPMADQLYLCQYAEAFNKGEFSGLQWGGYVARYPQQLGIITLLRAFLIVFGENYIRAFQIMVALSVPLLILSGCMILRHLTKNNVKVEIYYLFLMLLCVPMYAYSSFVYGDLLSTVLAMLCVWVYLASFHKFTYGKVFLFSGLIGLAVQLRQNLLILVVALGIVTVIKFIFSARKHAFIMFIALLIGVFGFHVGVRGMYAQAMQDNPPEIPAVLFMVMGLNDDQGRPGWHNNYEFNTFDECSDDVEAAKEVAYTHLRMYLGIYKENPSYMIDFFVRKMNTQWHAPMYQSVVMTGYNGGNQLSPIKEIYEYDDVIYVLSFMMKVYQMLLYGGILFLLVVKRKDWTQIENYSLLICVFGGFIFSLMWEAKTRYMFPYLLMQIPYMAWGIHEMISVISIKVLALKNRIK